jgi:hypothetical protein
MGNLTLWTEFSVAKLKKLAEKNYTAREIAQMLGPDFSRNAVIGKMNRMRLLLPKSLNPLTKTNTVKRSPPSEPKPKIVKPYFSELPKIDTDTSNIVSFMELKARMCRFPVSGQGFDTKFCGNRTGEDRSWCDDHRKIVYIKGSEAKRHGEEVNIRQKPSRLLSNSGGGGIGFTRPPE